MHSITLKDVSKSFNSNQVLKRINVTFKSPGVYGIIGRNGAGKSVMLKILIRFYMQTEGKVLFNNTPVNEFEDFPFVLRAFLETPTFLPSLSGFDNLKLLSTYNSMTNDEEINKALEVVGLIEEKDKLFSKYSLGMKQKLGIACAFMDNPDVIILDEPFNGIDFESANRIREYIKQQSKSDKIFIISTHIRDDLEQLCDEIYTMKEGVLKRFEKEKQK